MLRASLCPSSGEQECALPHMVFCTGAVKVTVRLSRTVTFTVLTACVPAPHNHSHHNQCRTPYAAVHTLVLLMMGIMMPEACWVKSLIINIRLVVLLVSLSSPYVHDARSHEPKKSSFTCHIHDAFRPTAAAIISRYYNYIEGVGRKGSLH